MRLERVEPWVPGCLKGRIEEHSNAQSLVRVGRYARKNNMYRVLNDPTTGGSPGLPKLRELFAEEGCAGWPPEIGGTCITAKKSDCVH